MYLSEVSSTAVSQACLAILDFKFWILDLSCDRKWRGINLKSKNSEFSSPLPKVGRFSGKFKI
ncbi:hypothetical protein NIES2119_28170 [[Phormidium ambiguum] IAM M-71]|uniref:Uncharacterized protein n=1 Tax=[Phormidium ambiguum] IAM M-71 TaxID=454136 RepID=A0A1U7I636_9CYAN|nr:hypothetical protein NIES2119_28170 [Phormidium ambiguum IAM M-71]